MEKRVNPDISVIIPAYNVEAYIERCVLSVVNGTFPQGADRRQEILLINDGSTDRTGMICDELAENYSDVRVIHQENGGLSAARNTGMEHAEGKYILFLDGDDELEPETLETLYGTMETEGLEALFFGAVTIDEPSGEMHIENPYNRPQLTNRVMDGEHLFCEMIRGRNYIACAVLYMVRRELYEKRKMQFVPRLIHEDEVFTPQVLFAAKRTVYRNYLFYRRYNREGSIMRSATFASKLENYYRVIKELKQFAAHTEMEAESRNYFNQHLLSFIKMAMQQYCYIKHPTKIQREYYKELRKLGREKDLYVRKKYLLYLLSVRMGLKIRKGN